ncbi:hypothetical protein F503_08266 [Ophiostoma piceae UAMH 11346]|uniref:Uncharacterized protein n=1 Tax=Ophiostoma piceae (strain UAMH 11346) TaxID=1262450 RepID=S3CXZ6_OPHP1|nr:hypothetical protein F503_08266 [Ophiostoma piceae UAMH 11346]
MAGSGRVYYVSLGKVCTPLELLPTPSRHAELMRKRPCMQCEACLKCTSLTLPSAPTRAGDVAYSALELGVRLLESCDPTLVGFLQLLRLSLRFSASMRADVVIPEPKVTGLFCDGETKVNDQGGTEHSSLVPLLSALTTCGVFVEQRQNGLAPTQRPILTP